MPIAIENNTDSIMAGILMDTGVPFRIDINLAKPIPVITPAIPPIEVSTIASVKNWNRMAFFLAPIAFLRPISFVLWLPLLT